MAGLWLPGVVDGTLIAHPSQLLGTPRTQKAQQPRPKARKGPRCPRGPPSELAEAK